MITNVKKDMFIYKEKLIIISQMIGIQWLDNTNR